jgi:ferric-dicitrate binding protein FerR (iron transport regulator)
MGLFWDLISEQVARAEDRKREEAQRAKQAAEEEAKWKLRNSASQLTDEEKKLSEQSSGDSELNKQIFAKACEITKKLDIILGTLDSMNARLKEVEDSVAYIYNKVD